MQASQQESFRASQGSLKKSIGGGGPSFKQALDQPLSNLTPITKGGVSSPPARDANPSNLNNNDDFDDDSEGVELMKEQMMGQAQHMVDELEAKLIERIKSEITGVHAEHDKFRTYIEKRVGEQHSYTNELKDELDRFSDRLKANQTEVLNYNKNMAQSLKKIRGDQLVQDEDLSRAWNVVSHILESLQNLLSCFES